MPQVTIVIPAYNAEATILESIHSALSQTLRDIEVIVIDDGSVDNTANVAREINPKDERLKVIQLPLNKGVSAARNIGFSVASGRWITPLDADDTMASERLQILVELAESLECDVLIDDVIATLDDATTVKAFGVERLSIIGDISAEMYIGFNQVDDGLRAMGVAKPLMRKSFLKDNKVTYKEDLRVFEDFDLIVQMLLRGGNLRLTPYAGYYYRRDRSTLSRIGRKLALEGMLDSSRQLCAEAIALSNMDVVNALRAREKRFIQAFASEDFYESLCSFRFVDAVRSFAKISNRLYLIYRVLAFIRYDIYKAFGVDLSKKKFQEKKSMQ